MVSHSISVDALATGQTLVFDGFEANRYTWIGDTYIQLWTWSGGPSANGTSSSSQSLTAMKPQAIAASINDADIDVTASVIETSTDEYSLLLRSASGADSAMAITVTEDDSGETLDSLTYTSYGNSVETVATSAVITIDGLEVRRGNNTVTDFYQGHIEPIGSQQQCAEPDVIF